jgi:hypothetical protein
MLRQMPLYAALDTQRHLTRFVRTVDAWVSVRMPSVPEVTRATMLRSRFGNCAA